MIFNFNKKISTYFVHDNVHTQWSMNFWTENTLTIFTFYTCNFQYDFYLEYLIQTQYLMDEKNEYKNCITKTLRKILFWTFEWPNLKIIFKCAYMSLFFLGLIFLLASNLYHTYDWCSSTSFPNIYLFKKWG